MVNGGQPSSQDIALPASSAGPLSCTIRDPVAAGRHDGWEWRRLELDGDHVDAPAGTFLFAPPGIGRTAFAEEPGTTIVAVGGIPGKAYEPVG
jgi:hypothetical protein